MLTAYFLKCIAEDIFKHQETSTIPYDFYIALSSTAPAFDGTGVTEPPNSSGYKRVRTDNSILTFSEADDSGMVSNHARVFFPESITPWAGISHYAIFDMPDGEHLLMYGKLNEVMNVPVKTIVSIPAGVLTITVGNAGESQ